MLSLAKVQEQVPELCLVPHMPPRAPVSTSPSPASLTRDQDDGTINQHASASLQPQGTDEGRGGDHHRVSAVLQI